MRIIGIDISKRWFDCFCNDRQTGRRFSNNRNGWQQFRQWTEPLAHVVMEASGPYYLGLACYLHEQQLTVSVLNPLVIRRYAQMTLSRTKTDAKDAALIAQYGANQQPKHWTPPSEVRQALRQLMSLREGLLQHRNTLNNQAEAFNQHKPMEPLTEKLIEVQCSHIQDSLAQIDLRMEELAKQHYKQTLQALLSIPGIGQQTAIMLLCVTDGFRRFDDGRQLASYVGLCPRVWESGSSIKGRGSICKLGSPQLRKLLYMCSWTAKRCNPACKKMYDRLKAKGKPEKVIKVAIAHKLLRQAFAVGTKKQRFNEKRAMAA